MGKEEINYIIAMDPQVRSIKTTPLQSAWSMALIMSAMTRKVDCERFIYLFIVHAPLH